MACFGLALPVGGIVSLSIAAVRTQQAIPPLACGVLNGLAAGTLTYTACVDMLAHDVVALTGAGGQRRHKISKLMAATLGAGLMAGLAVWA